MRLNIGYSMTGSWDSCYKCSLLDKDGEVIERSFPNSSGELVTEVLSALDKHATEPITLDEIEEDIYGGLHREASVLLPRLIELYNKAHFPTEPRNQD